MQSPFRIVIIFLVAGILGLVLVPLLPISLTPNYALPGISVSFNLPNAPPDIVEHQATSPLENALSQIQGIKKITSTSNYNTGQVRLTFDKTADMDFKRFEVVSLIRQIYQSLPENLSYPVVDLQRQEDQEQNPILIYSISAPLTPNAIQQTAEKSLRLALLQNPDIESVQLTGALPMQLSISYDHHLLDRYNLSPELILQRIRDNFYESYGGIYRNSAGQTLFLKTNNPLTDTRDLENILIRNDSLVRIALKDVAQLYIEEQKPRSYYRINGLNSINMAIEAKEGINRLALATQIKSEIEALKPTLPDDFKLILDYDDTQYLSAELEKLYYRSGLSILILVLFIFLLKRNLAYLLVLFAGVVVNLAITFLIIYLLGLSIHLYTLAGLTISFGLIIDNALVMLDHLKRKKDTKIFRALFAASVTTVAALGVIFFLPENEKQNLLEFGQVISINLLVSLLVALYFTPALYTLMVSRQKKVNRQRVQRWQVKAVCFYASSLYFLTSHRKWAISALVLLFGVPVFLLPSRWDEQEWYNRTIGNDFYQQEIRPYVDKALGGTLRLFVRDVYENYGYRTPEETRLYVTAEMKPGHTLEQMNYIMQALESYLKQVKGVDKFITTIYSGEYARLIITFEPGFDDGALPYQLKNRLTVRGLDWGGVDWGIYGVGKGFSNKSGDQLPSFRVQLKGYNYDELERQAQRLADKLLVHKRIQAVNINERRNWQEKVTEEFVLQLDPHLLALKDQDKEELVRLLQTHSDPTSASSYIIINNQYLPIFLFQKEGLERYRLWEEPFWDNETIYVLKDLASLKKEKSTNAIHKEDRQYIRIVGFDYYGSHRFGREYLEEKLEEMKAEMPVGYFAEHQSYSWGFDQVKRQYGLLLLLLIAIYFIGSILFENIKQPVYIISTVPISFIGLFLTFAGFGFYFDQGGYAAFILLGGLVVNASIFIINDLNNLTKGSYNRNVIKAVRHKAQPILLTIISTCLGLVPFVLEGDSEIFWFSLAAGTIGGLLFSIFAVFVILPMLLMEKNVN